MAINFVTPKNQESPQLVKWRRITKIGTTIVLAVWVVTSAGFLGWWVFVKTKSAAVSDELQSLLTQVANKSQEEVIIRKLDSRVKLASNFLGNRGDIESKLAVLLEATPEAVIWKYDRATDAQSVEVDTNSVAEVEDYTTRLQKAYTNVKMESLRQDKSLQGPSWVATISFGGLIK